MSSTIKLKHPIDGGGAARITEVTVRRPTVRDLLEVDRVTGQVEKAVVMATALTGLARPVVEMLDGADFQAISAEIERFFAPSRPTGKTS